LEVVAEPFRIFPKLRGLEGFLPTRRTLSKLLR
jgi:hypothetical protein